MMGFQRSFAFVSAAVMGLGVLSSAARAAVTYSFSSGAASVDNVAHTATLPIYLHETTSGASQLNADQGLFSFGLTAAVASGPGTIQSLVRNPAFDQVDPGTTSTFPTSTAALWAEQNNNFGNGPLADANGNVLLATLTLQGVTAATSLNISDFGSGTQTVDYAGKGLDPTTVYSTTVNVPEPASLAVVSGGVALLVGSRRRRQG